MHDPSVANSDCTGDAKAAAPIRNLRVTFWGVQGSCPIFPTGREIGEYARGIAAYALEHAEIGPAGKPALTAGLALPDLPIYGGDTSCIEVETAEGNELLFDLGTGVRPCSRSLLQKWPAGRDRTLYVFGTHPHLDHRMGLTFAAFCFARPNPFTLRVYGPHLFLKALDQRYGMFSRKVTPAMHLDDPLDYRLMSARFMGTELVSGSTSNGAGPWDFRNIADPVCIASTTVTAFPVYHGPTPCLAYKIQHGGASFVYCTDHELRHGPDPADPLQLESEGAEAELLRQCQDVDAAYFDGQYLGEEYRGEKGIGDAPALSRVDWGHSCIEDVLTRASACRIGRTYIGHHDPDRPYAERLALDEELRRSSLTSGVQIELARAGTVVDL